MTVFTKVPQVWLFSPDCSGNPFFYWHPERSRSFFDNKKRLERKAGRVTPEKA
jgi:hypothetical protein